METGMKTLTPDLAERKRILKDICRNHPQWKIRIALATVLFIAAVGVLGGTIGLLIRHPTSVDGIMAFISSMFLITVLTVSSSNANDLATLSKRPTKSTIKPHFFASVYFLFVRHMACKSV